MKIKFSEHIDGMEYVRACGICRGEGSYEQTYTVGCGGGTYSMTGRCDFCAGTGIRMTTTGKSVPPSVLAQIKTRAANLAIAKQPANVSDQSVFRIASNT